MPRRVDWKRRAEALKSLADETRLRVFAALMDRGETCVCELLALFGGANSNMSFHLRKLKTAGLVEDRKVGKWMLYRPHADGVRELGEWLAPLLDAATIPESPADGSMAALCEAGTAPLKLNEVRMTRSRGRLVVKAAPAGPRA